MIKAFNQGLTLRGRPFQVSLQARGRGADSPLNQEVDQALARMGLPLPYAGEIDWFGEHALDEGEFRRFAAMIMTTTRAYRSSIMSAGQAQERLDRLLELFEAPLRFASNYDDIPWIIARSGSLEAHARERGGWSWTPVSDATFDACLVVVGKRRIGCVVIEDED